jgi:hypothetical protein
MSESIIQRVRSPQFRLPDHLQKRLPLWYYVCSECVSIISPRGNIGTVKCPMCGKRYKRQECRRPNLIWKNADCMCTFIINSVLPEIRSRDDRQLLQNVMLRMRDREKPKPEKNDQ